MKLKLPEFDIKLRRLPSGQIQVHDPLRGKYVALTPEEWVRQHFVNFLNTALGYPMHAMANEVGLVYNGIQRRCDTVVYDRFARPLAIVEYKASTVAITQRVFDQIARYNMVMDVDWLIVSNGMEIYCCRVSSDRRSYTFVRQIPTYSDLVTGP